MNIRSSAALGLYRANEQSQFIADLSEWAQPGSHPLAILSTGYTAQAFSVMHYDSFGQREVVTKLIEKGLAVLSIDSGGTATFGNDTAIAANEEAVNWILADGSDTEYRAARDPSLLLVGVSMGFMDLMAWARTHQDKVAAAIGFVPAVNLSGLPALSGQIDAAYGGDYDPNTHGPTHDPMMYADELEFPIIILGSSDDTTTTSSDHAAFAAAAPNCQYVNLGATGGHAASTVIAATARTELAEFIAANVT